MRLALVMMLALVGCSDEAPAVDAGPMDAGPPTWASVQGILQRGCVFSSCHGGATAYPSLGETVDYNALVGVTSREVPALRLVAPGDPAASWMMIKLDGTMSQRAECRADPRVCGVSMPQGVPILSRGERHLIRSWISMGAPGPRDP